MILRERISVFFMLLCFLGFVVGTVFTLPPHTAEWDWPNWNLHPTLRGENTASVEQQFEKKLAYKDPATGFWGGIRYKFFNTGSKGVVIGTDNWLFTKEEFETTDAFDSNVKASYERIQNSYQTLKSHGIEMVMAWIPSKSRTHADKLGDKIRPKQHQQLTPPTNIPLVDGSQLFPAVNQIHTKAKTNPNLHSNPAFMRTDTHWSQEGASAMAEAVASYIRINYPELELTSKPFQTTKLSTGVKIGKAYEGDLVEFVPTGLFAGPASFFGGGREVIQQYQTEAAAIIDTDSESDETPDAALSLFGDEQLDVTLIGTSYSAQEEWHFEGFLKTALQADVLNLADEGQGPFAPMDTFLERLRKGEVNTKLVIWEFPERYLPRDYPPKETGEQS